MPLTRPLLVPPRVPPLVSLLVPLLVLLLSCTGQSGDSGAATASTDGGLGAGSDGGATAPVVLAEQVELNVVVTLDGQPAADSTVSQGGSPARWQTGSDGTATVLYDTTIDGDLVLMASHPEARIGGVDVEDQLQAGGGTVEVDLVRFETGGNLTYLFQDPGDPDRRETTGQCAHCHVTINEDWFASPHSRSASNPVVHDLYAGAAAAWSDQETCEAAGGAWWTGLQPGTSEAGERCYLGSGTLPDLNEDCGDDGPCDGVAEQTGQCADCHAPGIDGELGGRDLLEATDLAYDYGVHCDVCHKIESIDTDSTQPGVAGRLRILRPSEDPTLAGVGNAQPLTFGPYDDVINPRMGSVARSEFTGAELCSGCHQHDQAVLVPGASIDLARWPDGRLPIHSTYAEWLAGPFSVDGTGVDGTGGATCQSCHMPADGDVGNSADLGNVLDVGPGIAAGWYREPGAVRRHAWFGPRSDEQRMIDLAALVSLSASSDDDGTQVQATVKNVGPGHALPTGEPLRHMVLVLAATCGGEAVDAIGGDAIGDVGGYLDRRESDQDWTLWPGARVGDVIRVVQQTGAWYDYTGFGPFGDGSFDAEAKGMAQELVVGSATVVSVTGDVVSLDRSLPAGDLAWRVDGTDLPTEGGTPMTWAGAPGFTFARILAGADGSRMVPHHAAVDVVSDNRLLPQQASTSTHSFAPCSEDLVVQAALVYRLWPLALAAERGWEQVDRVIATASLELP